MIGARLLLCVDGSSTSIQAAHVAVELAGDLAGTVRAVYVVEDHVVARALEASIEASGSTEDRRDQAGRSVLGHVEALGRANGVSVETVLRGGDPLDEILDQVREWMPHLIVIGRTGRRGPASPLLGSLAAHVLEFAECPVVVTPPRNQGSASRG
jgi:nucleotide-binding universal stress UspA family protein